MVCWNGAVLTIARGALQVRPPSRVSESIVGPVTSRVPSGLDCSRSQTWYARPGRVGSAVTEFLSLKNVNSVSAITGVVLRHVRPPSYEVVATTALRGVVWSKLSALPYTMPSGPVDTHGSE